VPLEEDTQGWWHRPGDERNSGRQQLNVANSSASLSQLDDEGIPHHRVRRQAEATNSQLYLVSISKSLKYAVFPKNTRFEFCCQIFPHYHLSEILYTKLISVYIRNISWSQLCCLVLYTL